MEITLGQLKKYQTLLNTEYFLGPSIKNCQYILSNASL